VPRIGPPVRTADDAPASRAPLARIAPRTRPRHDNRGHAPIQGVVGGMMLTNARKDAQQVTPDWQKLEPPIDGVFVREVLHVPRDHGVITEISRPQWDPTGLPIVHIYQSRLYPAAIGAWSCHAKTIDRLFVNQGHLKIVLYDGREESPTFGRVTELHAGD